MQSHGKRNTGAGGSTKIPISERDWYIMPATYYQYAAVMLNINHLTLQRGSKFLLEDASVNIYQQEMVGIIGANGAGKSSLFSLLLGQLEPLAGTLDFSKKITFAHLAQEVPALSQTALDYVLDGDSYYRTLEHALQNESDPFKLASLQEAFEHIEGYRIESHACGLLHGLGFSADEFAKPVKAFSGGWRMRLNLARTLMIRAEVMLLDEPTNHLDLDAILFLEKFLKNYQGTLLIISHDKAFLNALCQYIIHIDNKKLIKYSGNYDAFESTRAEKLRLQQKAFEKQQKSIAHMQNFIQRFKAKASKAKQAQSRVKALEKMNVIAEAHADSPLQFEFKPCDPCRSPMVVLEDVNLGYGDKLLIKGVTFTVHYGDRIALLGPNGAGKSTFLKLLSGALTPRSGQITRAQNNLTIGYYEQHQLEQLVLTETPLWHFQQRFPTVREQTIRDHLGKFNFDHTHANTPVAPLSGGEKARLILAMIIFEQPNLLLLDEPTNHLDLDMRAALEIALQSYEGALILISHDRQLLSTAVDTFLLLHNQTVQPFDGDLKDYSQWLHEQNRTASSTKKLKVNDAPSTPPKLDKKAKNRLKKIEEQLTQLSKEKTHIESQLAEPSLYDNHALLEELLAGQQQNLKTIEALEQEWLDLQEE